MQEKEEQAIHYFNSGYNCAQSVLSAYAEYLDIDMNFARSITAGFGAGMGRLQETCGAVTGAFMIIGLHNSKKFTDNSSRKEASNAMIQEFTRKFNSLNSSINCRTLLNCDKNTEIGLQYFEDHNLGKTVYEKCISDSIKIINKLIAG